MQISSNQIAQVNQQIQALLNANNFYGKKLKEAGVSSIQSAEDFENLPFSEKNDLRNAYPLGLMTAPEEKIVPKKRGWLSVAGKNLSGIRKSFAWSRHILRKTRRTWLLMRRSSVSPCCPNLLRWGLNWRIHLSSVVLSFWRNTQIRSKRCTKKLRICGVVIRFRWGSCDILIVRKIEYLCGTNLKTRIFMITSDQLHNVLEREQALRGYLWHRW